MEHGFSAIAKLLSPGAPGQAKRAMHARLLFGLSAIAAAAAALLFRGKTTDNDETGETVEGVRVAPGVTLGQRAVEVLSRYAGQRGSGKKGMPGYHRGVLIDAINRGLHGDMGERLLGEPWCARAVRWAYEVAAEELGQPSPFSRIKNPLSGVSAWKGASFRRFFLRAPKVGAALLLGSQHATLIAQVLSSDTVITVEGNHGDAVAHVKRTLRPQDTIVDVEAYVLSGARGS